MNIFLDTSDINEIKELNDNVLIEGYTTNPSTMKKAGVTNYEKWAKQIISIIKYKPISFEVLDTNPTEIKRQADIISEWGYNVYVKIPFLYLYNLDILNKRKVNITTVFSMPQLRFISKTIIDQRFFQPLIVSIFAGRIADTGENPENIIKEAKKILPNNVKVLWASTREVFNLYQAAQLNADIITVSPEIFRKYEKYRNMDMDNLTKETTNQFLEDGKLFTL